MESFFSRYRNLVVLLAVLLVQVIGLAVQVRKPATAGPGFAPEQSDGRSVRLIRLWAAEMVTPFELGFHWSAQGISGMWTNYVDLRHTREQNKDLQQTVDRLRLEQAELREDALQGQRLQALMKFQENYAYQTEPAQVIGTSGSSVSRVVYLDKGSDDGLKPDMAVITGDGIVGKVRDVFPHTAQVLLINDQTSGAGVILEATRIRGILRGNSAGQPQVINILADQRIQKGELVLTAGGDQIFPRGLPVGVVEEVRRDPERGSYIEVVVKPASNLQHLDEVLVITSLEPRLSAQQQADLATSEELKGAEAAAEIMRKKAAAEMAERLPGLKDPNAPDAAKDGEENKPAEGPPLPPIATRPLQPLHPDRFSPGAASDTPAGGVPAADTPDTGGAGDAAGSGNASGDTYGSAAKPKAKQQPGPKPVQQPGQQPAQQPSGPKAPAPKPQSAQPQGRGL